MRSHPKIDSDAAAVGNEERIVRLLCSPFQYDAVTHQVSIDAFNLRMMGKNHDNLEPFASVARRERFDCNQDFQDYLQLGYRIWDEKTWETNSYYGYGVFVCCDALSVNDRVEIYPLKNEKQHTGVFYRDTEDSYFRGPLPIGIPEILEMLSDLASLITDSVVVAPLKA